MPRQRAAPLCRPADANCAPQTAKVWSLPTLGLLATLRHAAPPLFAAFPSPSLLLTATPAAGFLWRLGGRSERGGGPLAPAMVRQLGCGGGLGGSRITCAAAWDMFLAAGMGERVAGAGIWWESDRILGNLWGPAGARRSAGCAELRGRVRSQRWQRLPQRRCPLCPKPPTGNLRVGGPVYAVSPCSAASPRLQPTALCGCLTFTAGPWSSCCARTAGQSPP